MTSGLLLGALGLLIAAEGFVYAAFPAAVRRALESLLALPESDLRQVGLVGAALGALLAVAGFLLASR